jgi:hypothetical protein
MSMMHLQLYLLCSRCSLILDVFNILLLDVINTGRGPKGVSLVCVIFMINSSYLPLSPSDAGAVTSQFSFLVLCDTFSNRGCPKCI